MSHFPAGQVYSTVPAYPANKQTQDEAIATGDTCFAVYTAVVDFNVTGAVLLFTTDANRGRFFPIGINVTAVPNSQNGGTSYPPNTYIGWQNPGKSNAYDNWLSAESLQSISDNLFGSGMYDTTGLKSPIWNAYLSAPASTGVYINITRSNTVIADKRIVSIIGIYTG